jgi:biotin carboxylase
MKDRLAAAGIRVPGYAPVDSVDALRRLASDRNRPLVIKPVDSRGARGVMRLTANADLQSAFTEAQRWSPTGRVMVEDFVAGRQFSTESVLDGDRAWTPGLAERNYEYLDRFAPHMIENGGHQPPDLTADEADALRRTAEAAGRALGLERGIVKGDLVLTASGPCVIEIATRLSGGWFCTDQIPLATGVDVVGAALHLAVGDTLDATQLVPRHTRGVVIRYFFPPPGRVVALHGVDRWRAKPWVHRLGVFIGIGDLVSPPTNHTLRAGFVITKGATLDEAVGRARAVVEGVEIVTVAAASAA